MSEKNRVEITNMSYIDDRGGYALATVKYGDLYLRGITVRETRDRDIVVLYPERKGKDEGYYPIYRFSDKDGHSHDKNKIEAALMESYANLRIGNAEHREIAADKHVPISGVSVPSTQAPKVLNSHDFEDGNAKAAVSVAYKNLIINNVYIREGKDGDFASFPSYKKPNGEWGDFVTPAKDSGLSAAVASAYHEHKADMTALADPAQFQEVDVIAPFPGAEANEPEVAPSM